MNDLKGPSLMLRVQETTIRFAGQSQKNLIGLSAGPESEKTPSFLEWSGERLFSFSHGEKCDD